jgi:hypothetical protein
MRVSAWLLCFYIIIVVDCFKFILFSKNKADKFHMKISKEKKLNYCIIFRTIYQHSFLPTTNTPFFMQTLSIYTFWTLHIQAIYIYQYKDWILPKSTNKPTTECRSEELIYIWDSNFALTNMLVEMGSNTLSEGSCYPCCCCMLGIILLKSK